MSSPVIAVRPAEPVAHAKRLMLRHGIKRLVVLERGRPVGIVSMQDLARRLGGGTAGWRRRPIDSIPIANVMNKNLLSAPPRAELSSAAKMILRRGVGSLIVTEGGQLVGILTKTDLTRYFAEHLVGRIKVGELMTKRVITAERLHSIMRVVDLMRENNVGRVVIVDGKKPVGIVAESDIAFARLEEPAQGLTERRLRFVRKPATAERAKYRYVKYIALLTAEDVMTSELVVVEPGADASKAAGLMVEHKISGLPVVDGEELKGIITKTDLVRGIANLSD
jgi:CBS domain-containing protein